MGGTRVGRVKSPILYASVCRYLCAHSWAEEENVRFSKKGCNASEVLVVAMIAEYLLVSFYCY